MRGKVCSSSHLLAMEMAWVVSGSDLLNTLVTLSFRDLRHRLDLNTCRLRSEIYGCVQLRTRRRSGGGGGCMLIFIFSLF